MLNKNTASNALTKIHYAWAWGATQKHQEQQSSTPPKKIKNITLKMLLTNKTKGERNTFHQPTQINQSNHNHNASVA